MESQVKGEKMDMGDSIVEVRDEARMIYQGPHSWNGNGRGQGLLTVGVLLQVEIMENLTYSIVPIMVEGDY